MVMIDQSHTHSLSINLVIARDQLAVRNWDPDKAHSMVALDKITESQELLEPVMVISKHFLRLI